MMTPSSQTTPNGHSSTNSSPTDFAFGPPSSESTFPTYRDNIKGTMNMSPATQTPGTFSTNTSFSGMPGYFGPGSSFSSSTTSAGGSSFSSSELPPISHDFARPSTSETRRPATAGGALQSGWGGFGAADRQRFGRASSVTAEDRTEVATIDENAESTNSGFINPFASSSPQTETESRIISPQQMHQSAVDPHFNPGTRRSSDSHLNGQGGWGADVLSTSQSVPQQMSMTSAPSNMSNFNFFSGGNVTPQTQTPYSRPASMHSGRPQTSDGIPNFGQMHSNQVSLPSARTIVNQIDSYPQPYTPQSANSNGGFIKPYTPASAAQSSMMPFRDARLASMPEMGHITHPPSSFPGNRAYSMDAQKNMMRSSYLGKGDSSDLTFVPLGGPAPKKRPRRRYDEIERLYHCGWNGCEKSYGTLNHLNAHVAMQKHGEKRLPQEFKEMRKSWRKKKREAAAQAANAQYMASTGLAWSGPNAQRNSMSSSSSSDFDSRRDSSATMFSSSDRGSFYGVPSNGAYGWSANGGDSRPTTSSSVASSVGQGQGQQYASYPTTSYGQPAAAQGQFTAGRRASAPQHVQMPMGMPMPVGFRPNEGDHPTPTQQNPNPFPPPPPPTSLAPNGAAGAGQVGQRAFPFSTLTSGMGMNTAPYAQQQFAFNR